MSFLKPGGVQRLTGPQRKAFGMSLRLDAPLIHSTVSLLVWEPLVGPNIILAI